MLNANTHTQRQRHREREKRGRYRERERREMEEEDKGTVCVTGGTGYVASWLVMRLLQYGYSVHATTRSDPGMLFFLHSQSQANGIILNYGN